MRLTRLELRDVRSYEHAELSLPAGPVAFVGPNAHGKTNLLEAVHRVATGSSHRVASDGPLVRSGHEVGIIRAELRTDAGRRRTVELEVGTRRRTRTQVDGQAVDRASDAVGVLKDVLFAPEDLAIVREGPSERRGFLDELLTQRRPAYGAALTDYERVVRQRNSLLKQLRGLPTSSREAAEATLRTWSRQLVAHATGVLAARIAAVRTLAGPVAAFYRDLADEPRGVELVYESSTGARHPGGEVGGVPDPDELATELEAALEQRASDERERGVTLVGPHRDELALSLGGLPVRGYASHGEMWSLTLALRLATHEVLAEVGDRPVVLLDDVFAELDDMRRARLAAACERFDQVLVTAAAEADVPLGGARVDVRLEGGATRLRPRPTSAGAA